jgi:hypothetical protein
MAVHEKTKPEVQEIQKGETLVGQIMRLAPTIIFFTVVSLFFPWFLKNSIHIGVFLGSASFFTFLNYVVVPPITDKFFAKKFTKEKQKLEMENRIVSLVFNLSTGIPSYMVWLNLWPLVDFAEVARGQTTIMDVFNAWSIGYIFYDFLTLTKVYGKGASLIQWHHVGESLVCYSYVITPGLGSLYLLGGGCMQLSSGVLHVQRILGFFSTKPNFFLVSWKWFLTFIWAHSRIWVFPLAMYIVFNANPVGFMHGLLMLTGTVLTLMNAHWLYKIIRMKSLAF